MKVYTFRIKSGRNLRSEIETFAKVKNIRAGFIITCVGGVKQAVLRSADVAPGRPSKQDVLTFTGPHENNFEIISLAGTVSVSGLHLHMSIADNKGTTFGGHLKEGTIVHPTAEVVIGEDETAVYSRELDEETGFTELVVNYRYPGSSG